MIFTDQDHFYMQRALNLAEQGRYTTTPNPMVGCVIVKNGQIIGEGYHQKAGQPHAEVNAFLTCQQDPQGATLYVTLEPCSHYGRTPPCAEKIIEQKIKRVVVAMRDPNPLVAGKGIAMLQSAGIEVQVGLLEAQAEYLNRGFLKRMRAGQPWVQLKMAMSIDGRTAMANGESQWITNELSRADVQQYRAATCAILSTSQTVMMDDAKLNVRKEQLPQLLQSDLSQPLRQPLRVILDRYCRLTPDLALFTVASPILLVHQQGHHYCHQFPEWVECVGLDSDQIVLPQLLNYLGQRQINTLWVEAGATLAGALVTAQCIDELIVYIAPKLLGEQARSLCLLPHLQHLADAPQWQLVDQQRLANDIKLIYTKQSTEL